jgi:hypothetical protein
MRELRKKGLARRKRRKASKKSARRK